MCHVPLLLSLYGSISYSNIFGRKAIVFAGAQSHCFSQAAKPSFLQYFNNFQLFQIFNIIPINLMRMILINYKIKIIN